MRKARIALEAIVIVVSCICTIGAGTLLAAQWLGGRRAAREAADVNRTVANSALYAQRGFTRGPANAPHTLVIFSDFECPACRGYAPVLDSIVARHPNDVRVVERHYPLTAIHPFAFKAALAAECARRAGHYGEMRNALFGRPALLEAEEWGILAHIAQMPDTSRIAQCVSSSQDSAAVSEDLRAGARLGVRGTPTILLDSTLYAEPPTFGALDLAVTARLKHQP